MTQFISFIVLGCMNIEHTYFHVYSIGYRTNKIEPTWDIKDKT